MESRVVPFTETCGGTRCRTPSRGIPPSPGERLDGRDADHWGAQRPHLLTRLSCLTGPLETQRGLTPATF